MAERRQDSGMLGEVGVTGLVMSGGLPQDQPIRQLRGAQAMKVWSEMSRYDDVVGAALFAIEMLARQVEWRVEVGGESPNAEAQRLHVEQALDDMSYTWTDTLADILSFLPYGFAWQEIVYKLRRGEAEGGEGSKYADGKVGWRKFAGRAQETRSRWLMDEDGGVQAMIQRDPNGGHEFTIPIEKSLLFRTTVSRGNPEGRSILERAFSAWYFKKRIREIEAIGIERDTAGLPVAWVPAQITASDASTADQARYQTYVDLVTRLRKDEMAGVVMPLAYDEKGNKMYDLTLLTSGGARQVDTDPVIKRYDQRIAATLMADFMLLGTDSGNRALSRDKSELFTIAMNTVLDEVAEIINRHAIPRLLKLNGWDTTEAPKLKHTSIERVDLDALGNFIARLTQAGAPLFPDPELEAHLRELADLPEAAEEV